MIRTHNVMIRHETLLGKCVIVRAGCLAGSSWWTSRGTVALTYVSLSFSSFLAPFGRGSRSVLLYHVLS